MSRRKLLVVIVVLGIVSAVVVFAVRTSGESGIKDAVAAAPPKKGVLPYNDKNMVQLPNGKIFTGAELYDPDDGPTGSWALARHPLSYYEEGFTRNCGEECGCSYKGSVCYFDSPSSMVVLQGGPGACGDNCGKVLVHHGDGAGNFELYDGSGPAGKGPRVGQWTSARRTGRLEHDGNLPPIQPIYERRSTRMVQIMGGASECRHICGNVLITGIKTSTGEGLAELYDPKEGTFTPVGPAPPPTGTNGDVAVGPLLASLPRSQVLAVSATKAFVFDPLDGDNGAFKELGTAPASSHGALSDETAVLADGSVMVTSNWATYQESVSGGDLNKPAPKHAVDVFVPAPVGVGGTWRTIAACGETTAGPPDIHYWEKYCHILSVLPGGKVLAWSSTGQVDRYSDRLGSPSYEGRTYVFNPESDAWTRSRDLINKPLRSKDPAGKPLIDDPSDNDMPTGGILISARPCGNKCDKVLAVNYAPRVEINSGIPYDPNIPRSGHYQIPKALIAEIHTGR